MIGNTNGGGTPTKEAVSRLHAFAFCNAELLLEVDPAGTVCFASGVGETEATATAAVGQRVEELVVPADGALLLALLASARAGNRFRDAVLRFRRPGAEAIVGISGYAAPPPRRHCFLTVRSVAVDGSAASSQRSGATRLLKADAFSDRLLYHYSATGAAARGDLTFLILAGLSELQRRLAPQAWEELQRQLGAFLRAVSLEGDSAGHFGGERFALLHAQGVAVEGIREAMEALTRTADPDGGGCVVLSETAVGGHIEATGVDLARAAVFTVWGFAGAGPAAAAAPNLTSELRHAARRMRFVKKTIADGAFDIAFQPIVGLIDGRPHHFEALVRLPAYPADISPFDFIRFAEDVGLITEFDLAMCRKVIARLKSRLRRESILPVAVNISGRSLDMPWFVETLRALIAKRPEVRNQLMFEVTESARIVDLERANSVIQEFRRAGIAVCLDDFGAREAAFEYLHAFEVDFVKIDSRYVTNVANSAKDRAFLTAMSGLCHQLGIETIAEGIETETILDFLRACGIAYGQGFVFDRPDVRADLTGGQPGSAELPRGAAAPHV